MIKLNDIRKHSDKSSHLFLFNAFFIFGMCGTVGILIDLDHFIAYWLYQNFGYGGTLRIFHEAIGVFAGVMFIFIMSYIYRLCVKTILNKQKRN